MNRLALLLALVWPTVASAGGYYYSDSGIVATGRGGAWIAGANTQFAQRFNPAGLVRVDRPTITVGWSGVNQSIRFDRVDDAGNTLPTAKNQAPPFSVPELGFVTPLPRHFALAFGFFSPFAPSSEYEVDGPQRYSVIDTTVWQFSVGPSVAWKPIPQLSVGIGLFWNFMRVDERLVVTTTGPKSDGTDNPDGDVIVSASVWDTFTPWGNIGVLVEPKRWISIGLSFEPPNKYKARGPGSLDFTRNGLKNILDQQVYEDEDVALNLILPVVLRGGVAVRPIPNLEIELAGVYENWRVMKEIKVEDIDETLDLPANFRDVASVRLGGEWRPKHAFAVRTGFFYESSAIPRKQVSVALLEAKKWQVGAGGSLWLWRDHLRFDASFAWLFFTPMDTPDSTVTMINVFSDSTSVVGNGNYRANGWIVGLGGHFAFGSFKKKPKPPLPPDPGPR